MSFVFTFPPLKEYVMDNGLRMIWLSDFSHPVLTISLQLPVGKLCDPVTYEGIAELSINCMSRATQVVASDTFAEKFEHAGASLFVDAREEYSIFGARMLSTMANEIIPLFWEMITKPSFDPIDFKRVKKEMLTELKAENSDNPTIANKHFCTELFGPTHTMGRTTTIRSVKSITHKKMKDFYHRYIAPVDGTLVVAGAMQTDDMQKKWEHLFSQWHKKPAAKPVHSTALPVLNKNKIRLIHKPDYSQTTVLIGHQSINELHKDKVAFAIANYILGGGNFSSRLMARIRSETGQTYGISSHLSCLSSYGVFSISTSTQNHQLQGVISSIIDVYNEFTTNGPTESELEKAKQFASGNMAFELEGLQNVVEKLLWLRFFNRGNEYIESYESLILPLSQSAIKNALNNHFKSDNFIIIAVGKKDEIKSQLESFGDVACFASRATP